MSSTLDSEVLPHQEVLPSFSHKPPSSVKGSHRWPVSLESQAPQPSFLQVLPWVQLFLTAKEKCQLSVLSTEFCHGWQFGPLGFFRPWSTNRRRRWGFGIPSSTRRIIPDAPPKYLMIHFVWQFLTPTDRVACSCASVLWSCHATLRAKAILTSVSVLRQARPPPRKPEDSCKKRCLMCASALLRFHFIYGDFVRWLSGEFTNRFRNWDADYAALQRACVRPPPPSLPPVSFSRCKRASTEGVPLEGTFHSPFSELKTRHAYDNHPAVLLNGAAVMKKFAAEEEKSFHLHLPRFLTFFLHGLMLNPLQWVVRKGKGRICVDCTNASRGKESPCSPNTWIPPPSLDNPDECPPVYYGDAFQRFIRQIWRLRITHPNVPLRQHVDDIEAAFRRILYHPDMAVAFACVFQEFLIVPVGQVFGSRSAPSYFSQSSDLRAYVATCGDLSAYARPDILAEMDDHAAVDIDLAEAIPDSKNPPLKPLEQASFTNSSFVDDNGVVDLIRRIAVVLHQSVVSAYILHGFPGPDRRGNCFAADKFEQFVSSVAEYLGFEIDCDKLLVTWPKRKRDELREAIMNVIVMGDKPNTARQTKGSKRAPRCTASPKEIASIIGKLQSASIVAPWGPHLAFPLMQLLRQSVHHTLHTGSTNVKLWRQKGKVRLGGQQLRHLNLISIFLANDTDPHLWSCPIGLMVPRDPTELILSGASYAGVGGWSPTYKIMWRVMHKDLQALGFPLKKLQKFVDEPLDVKSKGLYINPLEFLGTIINIWLTLVMQPTLPLCPTGHIVDLRSDNTTAVSWCRLTALTKNELLQPWARLVATFLAFARKQNMRIQPDWIEGAINNKADCLSRSDNGQVPRWEQVCLQHSQLAKCRICLLPPKLLSMIAGLLGSHLTKETLLKKAKELLTLEPVILPLSSRPRTLISTMQSTSPNAQAWS